MVIDSTFVDHFVNPDLRAEITLRKDGAVENGRIDFKTVDIDTSADWYYYMS